MVFKFYSAFLGVLYCERFSACLICFASRNTSQSLHLHLLVKSSSDYTTPLLVIFYRFHLALVLSAPCLCLQVYFRLLSLGVVQQYWIFFSSQPYSQLLHIYYDFFLPHILSFLLYISSEVWFPQKDLLDHFTLA